MDDPTDPVPAAGPWVRFCSVFGLASLGLTLPFWRVLADAPEFFVAHQVDRRGVLAVVAVTVLAIPAVLGVAGMLPGRLGAAIRAVVLVAVGGAAAASVLQPLAAWSAVFAVAVVAGAVAVAVLDARRPSFRAAMAWLALVALLVGGWALGPSRVGRFTRAGEAPTLRTTARAGETPPVVVLVFDELPLTALLDSSDHIDARKFPNFARLAAESDWFRAAASVSPQTSASVPALLSGTEPDLDDLPVSADHPTNLFLQLANSHEVHAYEPITSLCPRSVCGRKASKASTARRAPRAAEHRPSLLGDASVVLGQALGSEAIRERLPSVAQGWAGFATDADLAPAGSDRNVRTPRYGTFPAQMDVARELFATRPAGDRPLLLAAHLIAPHLPWVALPDGSRYELASTPGLSVQGGTLGWGEDEQERRTGYQRLLLQLGALDRALGEIRTELVRSGIWDDAVVAVVADHGIQFEPGGSRAIGAGGAEVSSVPFLVKRPGQRKGRIDDRAALTIDLVPTVLHAAGVRSPSTFDGLDLYADRAVPAKRTDAFLVVSGHSVTPDQTARGRRTVVDRRARWIDPDGGWPAVYQPGVTRPLVGTIAPEPSGSPSSGRRWVRQKGQTGPVLTGQLGGGWAGFTTAVVTCNERIAGAVPLAADSGEATPLTLVADPASCPDPGRAVVSLLDADGALQLTEGSS